MQSVKNLHKHTSQRFSTTFNAWKESIAPSIVEQSEASMSSYESSEESDIHSSNEETTTFNIAKKETEKVNVWRRIVAIMLLGTATTVLVSVLLALKEKEDEQFETEFQKAAQRVIDAVQFNTVNVASVFSSRSELVTSYSMTSSSEWPFVTIPYFSVHGDHARAEALVETYAFAPIVEEPDRLIWEFYSVNNQGWIFEPEGLDQDLQFLPSYPVIPTEINAMVANRTFEVDDGPGPYLPSWQLSPVLTDHHSIVNLNLRTIPDIERTFEVMMSSSAATISPIIDLDGWYDLIYPPEQHDEIHTFPPGSRIIRSNLLPHSAILFPVFDSFKEDAKRIMGMLWTVVPWDWYLQDLLETDTAAIDCILQDSCGTNRTYQIIGKDVHYVGLGQENVDMEFSYVALTEQFATSFQSVSEDGVPCDYYLHLYPTQAFRDQYNSRSPERLSLMIAAIFLATAGVFLVYQKYVQQRQDMVMATAIRTSAIVSSLFPSNVRERIMKDAEEQALNDIGKKRGGNFRLNQSPAHVGSQDNFEEYFHENKSGDDDEEEIFKSKPIADLFPEATVLFADIVGFTAWSSEREPTQVFQLLETLYHAFDTIARRRKVFKVETIGDCYVAVVGLPEPRADHAVVMSRFARDCMEKMKYLVKKLDVTLGPGTIDLSMRFGLHSGPVTAGVLRGEKSRFQLFGDTVNTAARMESNGAKERIHISEQTANYLKDAGKHHWLEIREDKIQAKGKGELQTYWLTLSTKKKRRKDYDDNASRQSDESSDEDASSQGSSISEDDGFDDRVLDERAQRLVNWTVDQFSRFLKLIVARRTVLEQEVDPSVSQLHILDFSDGGTVLDELKDIVEFVPYDPRIQDLELLGEDVELEEVVIQQLRDFVTTVATLHNENEFHNLSHATHVTMSVVKLMSRIVAADKHTVRANDPVGQHSRTYGLRSDPLAQFAVVFSAYCHDLDHAGVPNAQLVREHSNTAETYHNRSILEQNSIDLAWFLLMNERYNALRSVIYANKGEMIRFRQIFVNAVIATDIADRDLKLRREENWQNVFGIHTALADEKQIMDGKATVMIDCLIQASDVAHTMQHFRIYRKWNELLFRELYLAYLTGRGEDPSVTWYTSEIKFFDGFILPLAQKLKDCGVFGASGDEYLTYAMQNRDEWVTKGKLCVEEYLDAVHDLLGDDDDGD